MAIIILFLVLFSMMGCSIQSSIRPLDACQGEVILFSLSPDFIIVADTDDLSSVRYSDGIDYDFSLSVELDGVCYDLIGGGDVVSPSAVYADAGESRLHYCVGEQQVTLSFVAPKVNYGCHPVNYIICRFEKDSSVKLNMEVGDVERGILKYGQLRSKIDTEYVFFIGYESERVVQLWGENILPIWKQKVEDDIEDIVDFRDAYSPASGPAYLRKMKAELNLSKDADGNLIYVTCFFVNRVKELSALADTLALHGERELLEGLMNPLLFYAESDLWNAPFCPPDVGAFPLVMHRISDDNDYRTLTKQALKIVSDIDSLAGNESYSIKHEEVIDLWRSYVKL